MRTLRTRLVWAFLVETSVFVCFGLVLFLLQVNATNQYKNITDNMVNEYQLTNNASNFIIEYNNYALNSSSTSITSDKAAIETTEKQINKLYSVLDKSISNSDPNTQASYIGLKNTIDTLMNGVNTGVSEYEQGENVAQAAFNEVNQLYGFVATDSGAFLDNSLGHIASIRSQVNRTYKESIIAGIVIFLFVITGSVLYALKFSGKMVRPIEKLTVSAEQISSGDMNTTINPELMNIQDETGRLANAFNVMFSRLKDKLTELNTEKASVEKKVVERTEELKDEKIRLEASIESLNIGFIMTDANSDIITINRAAKDILSSEIISQGATKIDVRDQDWTTDFIQTRLAKSLDLKASISKITSTLKPIQVAELNYNGRILRLFMAPVVETVQDQAIDRLGAVILLEDITEAKILERSKDEFFSIASHELRTPLTSIRGNSSMMLDYYKEIFKDQQLQEMMQDIHTSAIRLIDIVNDFLDVSRLEQGKVSFSYAAVSVEKVIESTAYEMKAVINEKKIYLKVDKLTLDTLPQAWVDENRLKQVVYNLVGNAAKFTEKGGITISARLEPDKDKIKVLVTDTGRGISQDSQQLLFHKFQQTGSSLLTRDTTRGTGLGLYISKMIVESMGGMISLDHSDTDKGSIFSFTLPVATPERQATAKKDNTQTNSATGMTTAKA